MILRSFLLFLSARKRLRHWMETSPTAGRLTDRFVAGETLDEAIEICRRLDRDCALLTLDCLGENVTNAAEAQVSLERYIATVRRVAEVGLPASVSVKLTQFGMDVSEAECRKNIGRLVEEARASGRWIEIDMESHDYVDRTLGILTDMQATYPNMRGVIQAYLYRSEKDVERLCERGVPVRLCKGAYKEPASVAFQKKRDVDAHYVKLAKILLERGVYPGIATHDPAMIDEVCRFAREHGYGPDRFEFQMLYGVRRDLTKKLIADGYRVRLYVPYGEAWYPYFMRRLAERPANVMFILRNLVRG